MSKVRITPYVGRESGRRMGWVKLITGVDPDGTNGYAVEGDFLKAGVQTEVEVGSVLLHVDPAGSVKNGYKVATVTRVTATGDEEELLAKTDWHDDFLDVRDALQNALNADAPADPRDELVAKVAALNPNAGEIGDGMLRQLVDMARSIQGVQ